MHTVLGHCGSIESNTGEVSLVAMEAVHTLPVTCRSHTMANSVTSKSMHTVLYVLTSPGVRDRLQLLCRFPIDLSQ